MRTVYAKKRLKDDSGDGIVEVPRHHALDVVDVSEDGFLLVKRAGSKEGVLVVSEEDVLYKPPRPSQLKTDTELLMHRLMNKLVKLSDGEDKTGLTAMYDAMYEALDLL